MAETTAAFAPLEWKWLRSRDFDLAFILGIPSISLATIALIIQAPQLFWAVLAIDLWVFGYHHVIATYTRLCFDRKSFRSSRFLIFGLLPMVAVATARWRSASGSGPSSRSISTGSGSTTRGRAGASRAPTAPRSASALYEDGWLDQAIFYAWPVLGILHRSHQDPGTFIGLPLATFPVPCAVVLAAAAARRRCSPAGGMARRLRAWQPRAAVGGAHALHAHPLPDLRRLLLLIDDITYGWLGDQHLAQRAVHPVRLAVQHAPIQGRHRSAGAVSLLHQPAEPAVALPADLPRHHRPRLLGLLGTLEAVLFAGLSGTVVLYQIVNFHHYMVDATIWKVRKPPMRKTLGLD